MTTATEQFRRFVPMVKVDEERREVHGIIAEEAPDKSGEIMDYAKSKPNFEAWSNDIQKASGGKSVGNVRAMHKADHCAGKLTAIEFNDAEKNIAVVAKIVDEGDWKKVVEGCYTGFSIGGKYAEKWQEGDGPLTRYAALPAEASLVDNPCMYGATFTMVRSDGATELRKFHATPGAVMRKLAAVEAEHPNALEFLKLRGDLTVEVQKGKDGGEPTGQLVKDATTAIALSNEAIAALKQVAAEMALFEGDPDTWAIADVLNAIDSAIWGRMAAERQAAEEAQDAAAAPTAPAAEPTPEPMAAAAPAGDLRKAEGDEDVEDENKDGEGDGESGDEGAPASEEDDEDDDPEAMKAKGIETLKKLKVDLEKQTKAVEKAIKKAAGQKAGDGDQLQKVVEAATAELRKQVTELTERLAKVEATPAESGRPVKAAEKSLGSGAGDAKKASVADEVEKLISGALAKGVINPQQANNLRIDGAAAAMKSLG